MVLLKDWQTNGNISPRNNSMSTEKLSNHRAANEGQIIILGGVSGSGKSTVGKALASRLGWRFIEGDDFHSEMDIAKMQHGESLNDSDRKPWLYRLQNEIKNCLTQKCSAVLACSALKASYRSILCVDPNRVHFVFLTGKDSTLRQRLAQRTDHFMGSNLLGSQLEALELPKQTLVIDIQQPISAIVESIVSKLTTT
jgi:gluconokinase